MNEYVSRRLIAAAVGAPAGSTIGTEKKFWTTVLTALNDGVFSSANNEHEFWRKFASLLGDKIEPLNDPDKSIVEDGQAIEGTGGTFTITVEDGVITGGTWEADAE